MNIGTSTHTHSHSHTLTLTHTHSHTHSHTLSNADCLLDALWPLELVRFAIDTIASDDKTPLFDPAKKAPIVHDVFRISLPSEFFTRMEIVGVPSGQWLLLLCCNSRLPSSSFLFLPLPSSSFLFLPLSRCWLPLLLIYPSFVAFAFVGVLGMQT